MEQNKLGRLLFTENMIIGFFALIGGIFYGLIFITVGILSSVSVSRYKLYDLLNDIKKNENIKKNKKIVSWLIGFISIIAITYGYYLAVSISNIGQINPDNPAFLQTIILCSAGTFGLFYSLAKVIPSLIMKKKKFYYQDLNIFICRPVISKVKSNIKLLAIIAIMLTITLVSLSAGLSINRDIIASLDDVLPYDITVYSLDANIDFNSIHEID